MSRLWKWLQWLTHPVVVFVLLQLIWLAITLIWVIWFVGSGYELEQLANSVTRTYLDNQVALTVLIVGCILLGMLLFGTVLLFIMNQRQRSMINQQKIFLSSVTHELRSPLASLQLIIETLGCRQLNPETLHKLHQMGMQDVTRLTRLVHQILLSSRLDRGILPGSDAVVRVDLKELFPEVVGQLAWCDESIGERTRILCDPDVIVYQPPDLLKLVFSNILENAVKYSPKGSGIHIHARNLGDRIQVGIKDEGVGLSPRERRKIFNIFYRAEVTRKMAIPGTGMGLFIVKSLLDTLGGKISVESLGRNKGSIFEIGIPCQPKGARRSKVS
ncbi:MAG: HAMP domain-containing sensor histidine kinase [Zetaproteobacteria bacterium]|nr:HAMP domain-containing sensor histidine kinase [Zetaproteobacteria bacterium]